MSLMKIRKVLYDVVFWAAFIYSFYVIVFKYAPDFTQIKIIWAAPIAGVIAIFYAAVKINDIMQKNAGTDKIKQLSSSVHNGIKTFFKQECGVLSVFAIVLFLLLLRFTSLGIAICFLIGVVTSLLAVLAGTFVSVKSVSRIANMASESLNGAFRTAYSSSLISGLCLTGISAFAIPVLYYIYHDDAIICGFVLGASLVALFTKIGGGIFAKASEISAGMVIKTEENISKDDCKNPLLIANKAGKTIENISGTISDLFESFSGIIIASVSIGAIILGLIGAFLPFVIATVGIFCSIFGSIFVRTKENGNSLVSVCVGNIVALVLFLAMSYYLITKVFLIGYVGVFKTVLIGVIAGCIIGIASYYYTNTKFKPVKSIAKPLLKDVTIAMMEEKSAGMITVFISFAVIALACITSFLAIGGMSSYTGGVYGICLAGLGMLSTLILIAASDIFGFTISNAAETAKTDNLTEDAQKRLNEIDIKTSGISVAIKSVTSVSAVIVAIALFISYALLINLSDIDTLNPFVTCSIIFGAGIPFLFCSLTIRATSNTVKKAYNEAKKQFTSCPKILSGEQEPDYLKCISVSSKTAINGTILPVLIAVFVPLATGLIIARLYEPTIGAQAFGGIIIGAIATGACMSLVMCNSDGAFNNAKKLIKENASVENSDYCTAIVDNLGKSFRSNLGSSLNVLIKTMAAVAFVCAGLFMA